MLFKSIGFICWCISVLFLISDFLFMPFIGLKRLWLIGGMMEKPTIPLIILAVFSFVLALIAVRFVRVQAHNEANNKFINQLRHPPPYSTHTTRADRRIAIINEYQQQKNLNGLHEELPAQAELDADTLATTYIPFHIFAWLLPVLGFIGTAGAMADAIVGFKNILQDSPDAENTIMIIATNVIPEMAAAFNTTMLALGTTIMIYISSTALKIWDEEALVSLDNHCVNFLTTIPSAQQETVSLLRQISDDLRRMIELPNAMNASANALQSVIEKTVYVNNQVAAAADNIDLASDELISATKDFLKLATKPIQVTITRE